MPAGVGRGAGGQQLLPARVERAVGRSREQAAGRDPADAGGGELGDRRRGREREHVHGHADRLDDRLDLVDVREAWRVDAVGAGVAIGDQPGDRVVEVVHAADVVLGAAREHHRLGEAVSGLRGFATRSAASPTSSIAPVAGS